MAFSTRARSTSGENGFSMKSIAPSRIASTATAIVPCAETTSTVASGSSSRSLLTTWIPSTGIMRRSVTTTSAGFFRYAAIASAPPRTARTSWPRRDRAIAMPSRIAS